MKFKHVGFVLFLFAIFIVLAVGSPSAAGGNPPVAFLPMLIKPYDVDFVVSGLEITQSVQTTNNTVPLVAGRSTVVRVFAQTVVGTPANVAVSITAVRNAASLGTVTVGPQLVPLSPSRADYASTFNVTLPSDWTSGNVQLIATVDSTGLVPETSEGNNSLSANVVFNTVPTLDVKIVPITYTHTPNGQTYPGQIVDHISDWIMRAYPIHDINISYRSPSYNFTGNLAGGSADWTALLYQVTDLWSLEAAPGQVYYASIPISNGNSQWFFSGIAGIGWLGSWRTSVGLDLGANDDSGILAGHEIGHNMGRSHAPCGVSNPDPLYPYADGSIGEYGLDIPFNALLSPATYKDMMSYCSPEWVSNYTYQALYNDQVANGSIAPLEPTESLFVRVRFDEAGVATLMPTYGLDIAPTAEFANGDYVIELLNQDGDVLTVHDVTMVEASEPGISVQAIRAKIPMPTEPITAVRLVHNGTVMAERTLAAANEEQTVLVVNRTAEFAYLSWGDSTMPALVRYTADDGATWTVLGLDVLGGQLVVDVNTLAGENGRFEVILADSTPSITLTANLAAP